MSMNTTPSGFTLVETLVAVLLLTSTIILPYYAIQRSLTATFTARDDLIANALAQEAIEYVRGVRDNNYLSGRPAEDWLFGLDGGSAGERNCLGTNYCSVDATRGTDVALAVQQCPSVGAGQTPCGSTPLYLSATGLYTQQTTGTRTRFVRYMNLSSVPGNPNAIKVTATVVWVYRGTRTVTTSVVLTNWL